MRIVAVHPPSWLTLDVFLRIFVPLLTFVLGVIATIWSKKTDLRKEMAREHAKNIVSLATDWYNQLIDLQAESMDQADGMDPDVVKTVMKRHAFTYVNSRVVLPRMILSLELVKNSGQFSELVETAEQFLDTVTQSDSDLYYAFMASKPNLRDSRYCIELCDIGPLGMAKLDFLLQKMAGQAVQH